MLASSGDDGGVQRRREGLLDGVPQAQEWGWATDRLELVEIEVARELSTEVESRATGADDASLGAATDLVREVRAAVLAGDVPAARTRWERLEQVVERWDDAPLTGRIRSTGVTLFGGLVEIAATPGPPAFLAPPAVRPGDPHGTTATPTPVPRAHATWWCASCSASSPSS